MNSKNNTKPLTRRSLLKTAGVLAAATPAFGIEPFKRASASFKGLGLTTYSMKRHMRWWWGKPTKGAKTRNNKSSDKYIVKRRGKK